MGMGAGAQGLMGWTNGIVQGTLQRDAALSSADAVESQAGQARLRAADAMMMGEYVAARVRSQATGVKARQLSAMAANGIDTSSGSGAATIAATDVTAAQDIAAARVNAARQAWGFDQQAQAAVDQADRIRHAGDLSFIGSAVAGALGGAGSAISYQSQHPDAATSSAAGAGKW